jgi:phosphate starvation-inducible PhoH-like protein
VAQLITGSVQRLILSRPAVEAGEKLGFLPGDMKEKVDPYLRPLYDALHDCLPAEQVERRIASGEIERGGKLPQAPLPLWERIAQLAPSGASEAW